MDFNTLVEELAARVIASLNEGAGYAAKPAEASPCSCQAAANTAHKPTILLLSQEQVAGPLEDPQKTNLDKSRLKDRYHLQCALQSEYKVNLQEMEAVIVYGLTNDAMGKVAAGICDSPYTTLLSQAILSGKKLYILRSQVELFRYEKSAPVAYFTMLREKLTLLERSGLTICNDGRLEDILLGLTRAPATACPQKTEGTAPVVTMAATATPAVAPTPVQTVGGEVTLDKKLITERDLMAAVAGGANRVIVMQRAIVTDLARDYGLNHNVIIVRG